MITPKLLKKGQTIGLYSPSASLKAAKPRLDLLDSGISALNKYGFKVKKGKCTNTKYFHMSGSAKERANEIHDLFLDKDISAIFPTIGGHVASQILKYIDLDLIKENPKIFLGFSDSSLLGSYITDKTGLMTFHSVCDVTFGFGRLRKNNNPMKTQGVFSTNDLWDSLVKGIYFKNKFSSWTSVNSGIAEGRLIGGNIKGIQALIGTPYEPDWNNKVLYWEAMDQPHVIMQSYTHLVNSGMINKISGLIIGKVSHIKDTFYNESERMEILEFIKYISGNISIPIVIDADIGHDIENITMPNGLLVKLTVTNENIELKQI